MLVADGRTIRVFPLCFLAPPSHSSPHQLLYMFHTLSVLLVSRLVFVLTGRCPSTLPVGLVSIVWRVPEVKSPGLGDITTSKMWIHSCFRLYGASAMCCISYFCRYFAVCGCRVFCVLCRTIFQNECALRGIRCRHSTPGSYDLGTHGVT